jgi:hypothetical protein
MEPFYWIISYSEIQIQKNEANLKTNAMPQIIKTIRSILTACLFMLTLNVSGQGDNCRKLTVAIYQVDPEDDAIDLLNKKYGTKSKLEWRHYVDDMVLQNLQGSCPEINFVSRLRNEGSDPDYMFVYILSVIAIDTDIKIPGDSIVYTDPETGDWSGTEYTDPVYNSEPGFWVLSRLVVNSPCLPVLRWILWVELTKNLELEPAINENLMGYYRMINVIDEHEARKSAPAREPEMEISLEKDYLSPLDKESREMEIYVKVKDCHGRYVYYPSSANQPVYYQKVTGRCEFKNSIKCADGPDMGDFHTVLINKEYRAIGEYHLKKGIDSGTETVTLKTCGISEKANRAEQKTLIIRGLEITVKPVRKEIYQEEQTDVVISFDEVDPDGKKEPISGKELRVKVTGLVNGEITPKSGYVTDSRGETRLTYKAGDKDEKITLEATFQPPDYPDKAVGKGSVLVKPPEYDAAITVRKIVKKEILKEITGDTSDGQCQTHTEDVYDVDETIDASIYIQLKLTQVADMPIYNQRWEYYTPINVNISGFSIQHNEKHRLYGNVSGAGCAVGGSETNVTIDHQLGMRKINEPTVSPWILAFDSKTNKAVKMIPAGYGIEYEMTVTEDMESRRWDKDGESNDSRSDTKISEHNIFKVGPVEDPKPDPTFKPGLQGIYDYLREEVGDSLVAAIPVIPIPPPDADDIPKINPDLIVQFGDGVRSFGGRGHKETDNPTEYGYEKTVSDYDWQVTRRKTSR